MKKGGKQKEKKGGKQEEKKGGKQEEKKGGKRSRNCRNTKQGGKRNENNQEIGKKSSKKKIRLMFSKIIQIRV